MKTNMKRSHRRKLPVAVMATSTTAAMRHRDVLADPEVVEGQADADELGGDGEEVEDEQVADREGAPEPAEALVDQPGVADAGDRAQADHHLLVDHQDRDEQRQRPQQGQPVVLPRLGVGGDAAGVVVAHHDDESRAHDGEQGEQPGPPGPPAAPGRAGGWSRRRPGCRRGGPRRAPRQSSCAGSRRTWLASLSMGNVPCGTSRRATAGVSVRRRVAGACRCR